MMIVKKDETYCLGLEVPEGWTLVKDGFTSNVEAQQWLWNEIDSIPEGYGLP
jgi:uncharacterized protein YbdZ (MbtH family)